MEIENDDKDGIEKTSTSTLLFGFATSTGMHGLGNIAASGGWIRRIFWIILFLAALGILIWQIYLSVEKLISYETATTTNTLHVSPMYFPAVTICNMNPVNYRELKKANTSGVMNMKSVIKTSSPGPPTLNSTETSGSSWTSKDQTNRRTDFSNSATFFGAMNGLSNAEFNTLGVRMSDVLVDCSFEGKNCVPNDFTRFRDPRHGYCYTFNMVTENSTRRIVNDSGISHALDITLYVDQDNYIPDIITNAGYRVLVHDPFTPPLPELHGNNISPGFETSLSVHTRVFVRETSPYGTCVNHTAAVNKTVNTLLNQLPMTQPTKEICMRTCTQKEIITACHCYSYQFGFTSADAFKSVNNMARNTPCNTSEKSTDNACVEKVQRQIAAGKLSCKSSMCKSQECVSARYDVKQSMLLWPAEKAFSSLLDKVKTNPNREMVKKFDGMKADEMRTFIYRNFVKIKVYFSDLEITFIQTTRSYEWLDFIADFGGNSGLWLGFSILTFFELVELVADFCKLLHSKLMNKNSSSKRDESLEMGNSKRI